MPGKHVHFDDIPATPQPNYSYYTPSSIPPPLNQSGSPYACSPLPSVPSRINHALSAASEPLIRYDFTLPIANARVHPSCPDDTMFAPATEPPLPYMIITCPALPNGSIRVDATQYFSVAVVDVLNAVYASLRSPMSQEKFARLPRDSQRKVTEAFQRRYQSIADEKSHALEKSKGLKHVDLLGDRKIFGGLKSTSQGPEVWELCLLPVGRR